MAVKSRSLRQLISQLEVVRQRYRERHGCEPRIFDLEVEDDRLRVSLCRGVRGGEVAGKIALRPYLVTNIRVLPETVEDLD